MIVQHLLPEKSNFTNMKMLRELREELSFSAEELDLIKFQQVEGTGMRWDSEGAEKCKKVVSFNPHTVVMVMKKLEELDKKEELERDHVSLYEKFVLVEDKKDEAEKVVGKIE